VDQFVLLIYLLPKKHKSNNPTMCIDCHMEMLPHTESNHNTQGHP
jgi:hypothetical protein